MREIQVISHRVALAMLVPTSSLDQSLYHDVLRVADCSGHESIRPVVFWRKWFQTPGLQETPEGFRTVALDQVYRLPVVFVHCHGTPNGHLTDGLLRSDKHGVGDTYVLTHSLQFTDEELRLLQRYAYSVFVTHSYEHQKERIREHCPDRFEPFPHLV